MKFSFDEVNELLKQQEIRIYSQDIYKSLSSLRLLVKSKDRKIIMDIMSFINSIGNEAIENIEDMIEGNKNDD
ncbi:hypothetical protein SD457_06705 [Coprobacillaceae bacterium CR2/5/TPMF4]|nr:hypothetical protein SD457_06705 [Coprobacillaceae bacterium CR2/5/TPMF4]